MTDALEVSVVLVFGEPAEDVDALLPIELKAVRVLVVNVVLRNGASASFESALAARTNLGRHLVDVNSLLDPKLGDEDVERLVENADDGSGANDRAIALSEVGDEDAEEEVGRLLLSKARGVLLHVAGLRDLRDGFGIEEEPCVSGCKRQSQRELEKRRGTRVLTSEKHGLELAMDHDIGVTTDRRREVRVEREVESVVLVLGDIEHSRAEVLGSLHGLGRDCGTHWVSDVLVEAARATYDAGG